jgi:serine/threonine-protein kinase
MVADGDVRSPAPSRPPFHPESLLGTTLDGRYRIAAHLASGGMGAVFRAEHVYMRKEVALKVLRPDLSASPDLAERFRRESEIAASLDHENIVRVTDFGRSPEGYLFLAMELLEGESLYERLRRTGPMSPDDAVPILLQVCAGLDAAHRRGVVHRDLKPENIFLEPKGSGPVVKILDFGIAKISQAQGVESADAGMVVGTPEYLSPEQAFGQEVDSRADIYALGIVAWRMLAGRHPFQADSPRALVVKQATEPVPPLGDVRPELAAYPALLATIARACAKSPDQRPASAAELAGELARCADRPLPSAPPIAGAAEEFAVGESVTVSLPTPLPSVAPARPRRRPWPWLGAAAVAALALAAGIFTLGTRPAHRVERLLSEGRPEQAREAALAALEDRPGDARLRMLLGRAQQRLGQPAAALDSLEAAAQLEPGVLDAEAVNAIAALLSRDRRSADRAARLLARVGPAAAPALVAVLPRTNGAQRLRTLDLIRTFGAEDRIDLVAGWSPLLQDPDCELRRAAVRRLAESGSPSAIPYLKALAERREERSAVPVLRLTRTDSACGAREAEEALARLPAAARHR